MGSPFLFGPAPTEKKQKHSSKYSLELLHRHECKVCPLNNADHLECPKMDPGGPSDAPVYILSDVPSKAADAQGRHLVGTIGNLLRRYMSADELDEARFNFVARCYPGKGEDLTEVQIEACRPSIIRDIEKTRPRIVIGLGAEPLHWAIQSNKISLWRGRYFPLNIGSHTVWYFPVMHPDLLMGFRKDWLNYGSDEELAFKFDIARALKLVHTLPDPHVVTPKEAKKGVHVVTDFAELRGWFDQINSERLVGFDWETPVLRPYRGDSMVSAAFSGPGYAFSFPLHHPRNTWTKKQIAKAEDMIAEFLRNDNVRKVAHNLPFELEWAADLFGWDILQGAFEDTQSQAFVIDERRGLLNLNDLCQLYFGLPLKSVTGNIDTLRLREMDIEDVCLYNGLDAKFHRMLYQAQRKVLEAQNLQATYRTALKRVAPAVAIQLKGVPLNQGLISENHDEYTKKIEDISQEISDLPEVRKYKKMRGAAFRPSANPDVLWICKNILGKKDMTRTGEEVLKEIDHPLPELILRYRSAAKMLSTYIDPVRPDSPLVYDGKLHPVLNTTFTATSRTSSDAPNIQNWPKHDETAAQIRNQVAPRSGYTIVSFDYGGIQARNVAQESRDKALVESFWNDYDIHADWRDRLVEIYPKWIKEGVAKMRDDPKLAKAYRQRAKNEFVFASFFGAHPPTTAAALGVPREIAEELFEQFWHAFPGIKSWHESLYESMIENGYVTGLSGFRRRLPISQNELINTPIQADEAIIVCDAMARLVETGDKRFFPFLMVHDDLSFIWPKKKVDEYAEYVVDVMLDVQFEWAKIVPTVVEMSVGDRWGDLKEVAAFSSKTWKGQIEKKTGDK